nr:putative F-box protein At2g02030 [Aegilops tauschii subsp. strangulata]
MTTTTTPAAEQVSLLPEDTIFEILSWLPAKSLCRSRCVSKKWHTLVSNQAFVAVHSSRAEALLVTVTTGRAPFMAVAVLRLMDMEGNVVRVVKTHGVFRSFCLSFDGLACLLFGPQCDTKAQVIDLATGKVLVSSYKRPKCAGRWVDKCSGFGRTAQSGVHKIFGVILESAITGLYNCVVLTVGDDDAEWRPTQPPPYSISAVYDGYNEGVTFNGYVHFLSLDEDIVIVICFDLETEGWKVIQGPPDVSSHTSGDKISIAELNGALCVVRNTPAVISLWLLADPSGRENWVKTYTIRKGYTPIYLLIPLRIIHPSGKLLFCHFYDDLTMAPEIQMYDPSYETCTVVINTPTELVGRIRLCSSHTDPRCFFSKRKRKPPGLCIFET